MTRIQITGRIPSKKNSRQTDTRTGRSFPSKAYADWHKEASLQLIGAPKCLEYPVKMTIVITFPDRRRADLTNKAESIMDLLCDCGVLQDDSWPCVPILTLEARYSKDNPKAEIYIETI
jgi:Holliday junction resolvase RusA-like endonuclease